MAISDAVDEGNDGVDAEGLQHSAKSPITFTTTAMKPEITRKVAQMMPSRTKRMALDNSQDQDTSGHSTDVTLVSQVQLQKHSPFGAFTSCSHQSADSHAMATATQPGSSIIGGLLNLERQPAAPFIHNHDDDDDDDDDDDK